MKESPPARSGVHSPAHSRAHSRGFAVVMAMLVVALAASIAAFMAWQQSLWVRQTENLGNLAQADAIARSAGRWIQMMLSEDAASGNPRFQTMLLSGTLPAVPVETGQASVKLVDMQSRFNLNNLVSANKASAPDVAVFQHLLSSLGLSPDLANAVVDWIDADGEPTFPGGAEDADYLALTPPYRAANQPLQDVDELIRVKGFDAATLAKLRPFVAALPAPTQININSVSAEVLSAYLPSLPLSEARALVAARVERPFKDLEDAHQRYPELELPAERFSIDTQYFVAVAAAKFDRATVAYQMLLGRSGKSKVQLLWQKPVAY
jgi:general secretion pathway protein K